MLVWLAGTPSRALVWRLTGGALRGRHPTVMLDITPLAMLKHLMEEHRMNVSDLGRVIGSQSNASLILSGKRAISKRVMELLAERFGVAPGVFL